jgi:tetratricopeptide (TPR) repeat protein
MVREYLDQARRLSTGNLAHEAFLLFDRANATGLRDPDATIRLASRALEINPVYPSARLILARAYQKKAQFEKAFAELSRTIQMGPDRATLCHALFSRGTIFMAQGQTQEAVLEWEKVIEINGSAAATRSALANLASSPRVN